MAEDSYSSSAEILICPQNLPVADTLRLLFLEWPSCPSKTSQAPRLAMGGAALTTELVQAVAYSRRKLDLGSFLQ